MTIQKDLYPLSEAQSQKIELMPESLVAQCKSGAMAIRHTALNSGYAQEELAQQIGKAREVLSRACNGRGGLDVDTLVQLMATSGSAFILQYMAHQIGGKFVFESAEEKELRLLTERMEVLKSRRAA
jgi:transcriptional regulator with XRE-family HTH domain